MKQKIILFLAALVVALTAGAQSPFYKKCENNKDITTVFITKSMLEEAGNIKGLGFSDKSLLKEKIDNVQVVTSNGSKGRKVMEKHLGLISEKEGYELLMQVNTVRILRQDLGKGKSRFAVIVNEQKEMAVVTIEGSLTLDDVMRCTRR